jgi:hypothetical protein
VIDLTHAHSTFVRIREISGRHRPDDRTDAPLTSEADTTRTPVASLDGWMAHAETPGAAANHSKMKDA